MTDITQLQNGLTVASDHMHETETVSINVWVNTGSRHEKEELSGISHFLEHMAFKGTKNRTAKQIAEEFDDIGGIFNAHTSRENTVYYAKVLKKDFELALNILADILQHSTFDPEELERERNVVLQEIAMCNDTPDDIIFDHYQETAFKNQPLGRSILGTEQHLKCLAPNDLKKYIEHHYQANRIVLGVAGNIEHSKVVKAATKEFTHLTPSANRPHTKAHYTNGEYRETRELEQVHLVFGFESVSYLDDRFYTMQLLGNILGGGMSSRLFQEVREKRGLAYTIHSYSSAYNDVGLFTIYSGTSQEKSRELLDVTCQELKKAAHHITQEELDRAKNQVRASLLMGRESSSFRSSELGRHLTCFGRIIPLEEILAKVDAITKTNVTEAMQHILTASKPTFAAIGQLEKLPEYGHLEQALAA